MHGNIERRKAKPGERKRGPDKNQAYLPTDKTRRTAFLQGLRESGGSFSAACRASAPHLADISRNPPAASTWKALIARDPEFAAQVDEVMAQVRDDIEEELHRRSVKGVDSPVFQKAQRVFQPKLDENGQPILDKSGQPIMVAASITRYSDALLMKRAAALMPDKYSEKRTVDINYNNSNRGAWTIGVEDLAHLSTDDKSQLAAIMDKVRDGRGQQRAIAYQEQVEDASFDVVAEDDGVDYAEFDLGHDE